MKTSVIAVVVVGVIALETQAIAQIPVTDSLNAGLNTQQIIGQAKELLQTVKSYGTQLQQLQQEVQTVMYTGQTVASLVQNPSLGAALGLMNMTGIQNPLPINPYSVMSLASGGYGGGLYALTGKLGALNGLVTGSYNSDHIADCAGASFTCQEYQRRAESNAGIKGMVSTIYGQMADHVPVLQALRERASTATTPAERENVMVALASEQAWATNAGNQLNSVAALASVQRDVRLQREEEKLHSDIQANLASRN